MNTKAIERLDDRMDYYFGFPDGTYAEVLGEMMHTKVNTCLTSSLPLAEFWQPANLKRVNEILKAELPKLDLESALKYFEFPTSCVINGKPCGPKSMTDLMVMDGLTWKIATEGKFTEYHEGNGETGGEWLRRNFERTGKTEPYMDILRGWFGMIQEASCTDLTMDEFCKCPRLQVQYDFPRVGYVDVGYQFLHRTASACFKANGPEKQKPVLLYQLFYKSADKDEYSAVDSFISTLEMWARSLLLTDSMKFLIMSVPISNADEVSERYSRLKGQENARLFEDMKHGPVFHFDFDDIELENVRLPRHWSDIHSVC